MSSVSNLKIKTSLQTNGSTLKNKKINKIKKTLLYLEKDEISTFNPLKVKVFKEEKEDLKEENKIKIPLTFKNYFEDYKKNKEFINQTKSGIITPSTTESVKTEQVDSSDLVNSD